MKEYIIKIDEDKKDIMGNCPLVEKPQELVRCKDCKYWDQLIEHRGLCHEFTNTQSEALFTSSEWFCADGERRTE